MIRLINKTTGGEMWVHESRLDEYLAAGHKFAAPPTNMPAPPAAPEETPATASEETPAAVPEETPAAVSKSDTKKTTKKAR